MALFNAAARYCRFGIASTQLLAAKLQNLVFGNRCFVHRNALDSLNYFRSPVKVPKATLDIFYGSGTLAHNADFIDLALPAIVRILDEYPNTRLVIAGHLKLPLRFTKDYNDRFRQLPLVKKVQAYWSLLERSDINLAVLYDDEITGCKSELKWLEAACLGVPSIVSNTANYRDIIHHGEDALMAATPEEWYQSLKELIDAPGLRMAMAERAQMRAQAEYGVDVLSHNICGLLEQALHYAQPIGQSKKKKIALVNVFFPPQTIGGATRVVADNFDILQKDYGNEFDLCVFTSNSECKEPYQMTVYNYQGARVYRATILWRENIDWHPSDEKMGELFKEFLAVEQPDLIHFHCIQRLTGSVVEAAQKANVPYIVTVHDAWWISDYQFLVDADGRVYPEGHPDPYELRTLPMNVSMGESSERVDYLKRLLKGARKVLTVSNAFASIYRKNEIHDIQLNKNGLSESVEWTRKDTSYTGKVVCAHIGGMAEHKGYFLLKTAVEKIQPKNIEMLVVDLSKEEGYIQKTLWGSVPVTFLGRVNQARVPSLYRQIDVLFAPSIWPESFGLVTREAAACGCWVVASSMGGIGEDVVEGESGFVVEPTHAAITDCLEIIDNQHEVYKKCTHIYNMRLVSDQVNELIDIYKR
jgi:glycosyltransferase involved in cell wall biosynthesis